MCLYYFSLEKGVYSIQKVTSTTINVVNAYGTYQHSVVTISLNTSLDFGISTDGTLGAVLSVSPSVEEKFDGMRGTQAWISVTW